VYFIHVLRHDPSIYTEAADPRLRLPAATIAVRWTIMNALWWIAATGITTATSKVIYGLRKEVRDARSLGQYTLTEKLGEGGMGVVYLARHALLRRPSAIKLLPSTRLGPDRALRFEREVQLTASLSHPNTIRVFDYGRTPDGIFYYVMEYLAGASLEEVVAHCGPLPAGRVIHILDQVAGALSEAHGIGLIHRDIKPANILLTEQGGVPDVAKVLDFGLVKQLVSPSGEPGTPALSQDNAISGTPMYMAPEAIITPERIDARADLYALGAVGYFLLTGKEVFTGHNVVEVCGHHLHSTPPPPSERIDAPIPADLEQLILTCLKKSPDERVPDARTLQTRLRACQDAQRWSEEDARQWFAKYGPALRAQKQRSAVSGSTTVAVDLGLRLTEAQAVESVWNEVR
jgi:serine/threonine protein kinase